MGEKERIDQYFIDRGLGEPIHVEETNEIFTQDQIMDAVKQEMAARE